ncbi:MAG: helix-turn-helix domain-containing protein, partial [Gammaproteobacteria bacterium]
CFGVTVTDYLKTMRLDAAYRDLIAAHPSRDTVTAIALSNGHSHLGRFSSEFQERFGQLPRETLRSRMGSEQNGTYLRQIMSKLRLLVIPAQAGIQGTKPLTVQLDPGLRRDDGGFGLSKCHLGQSTFNSNIRRKCALVSDTLYSSHRLLIVVY